MYCILLHIEISQLIHLNNQSGFTRVFILNENFQATYAVLLFASELDPASKINSRGISITSRKRGMNSVTPHLLLNKHEDVHVACLLLRLDFLSQVSRREDIMIFSRCDDRKWRENSKDERSKLQLFQANTLFRSSHPASGATRLQML